MVTILIVLKGGEWTVVPEDVAEMKNRRQGLHKDRIDKLWRERHGKKAAPFLGHDPIVIVEGEEVEFKCPVGLAFAIGAKKNPDVDEMPFAPDDPFGPGLRTVPASGAPGTATTTRLLVSVTSALRPGPRAQGFYKFHGWVYDGEFIPVDPDGYCG